MDCIEANHTEMKFYIIIQTITEAKLLQNYEDNFGKINSSTFRF